MAGSFKEIFNVSFLHDYFTSGLCKDFHVHVPTETQELLNLYQMRVVTDQRTPSHSFSVMMKGNDPGGGFVPQKAPSETFGMVFLLELKQERIARQTTLPDRAPHEALYFYNRNSDNESPNLLYDDSARDIVTDKLIHETIFVHGKTFKHSFIGDAPGSLTVALKQGETTVQSYPLVSGTTAFTVHVDATNLPSGHYTLDTGTETIPLYLLDEAPQKPVFALVEIEHSTEGQTKPFRYDAPTEYRLQLERTEQHWRFYIVAKQSMGSLTIDPVTTASPPYSASITFTKITTYSASETDTINNLQAIYGATQPIVLFKSDDPIPAYQGILSGIQLKNGTTLVMDNLPNPPASSRNGEQVVCIAPAITFPIDPGLDSADQYGTLPPK